MSIVEVRSLCKVYPNFILDDVSFDLASGRICGFIGRNGSGKTTTIKSMIGLVHPSAGEVFYFGQPFDGNEERIKQRIGYSTGTVNYYPKKRIKDILDVTRTFYTECDEAECREFLAMFDIDESKTPSELSEGMKVKLNLLLALSHRAEVLILDEPTSGLDPFSRDELLDLFSELKGRGVAIFFSTHIISDLERCAEDIVYIRKGKLVAACSMAEFAERYIKSGETLEDAMLRMEKEPSACRSC